MFCFLFFCYLFFERWTFCLCFLHLEFKIEFRCRFNFKFIYKCFFEFTMVGGRFVWCALCATHRPFFINNFLQCFFFIFVFCISILSFLRVIIFFKRKNTKQNCGLLPPSIIPFSPPPPSRPAEHPHINAQHTPDASHTAHLFSLLVLLVFCCNFDVFHKTNN